MDTNKLRLLKSVKIDPQTKCWIWTAGRATKAGYGRMWNSLTRKADYAHRISFIVFKGSIPETMEVCHTCDNTMCVNPDHLFTAHHIGNMHDMVNKGRAKTSSYARTKKWTSKIKR